MGMSVFVLAGICINASGGGFGVPFPDRNLSPSVYTWQQTMTGDWQSPSSWAPERTNPAPDDVLVFNTAGVTTATNVPTETIGQLIISGNITVNLQATEPVVLTISGGDGDDLTVATNSALNLSGDNPIICSLATAATSTVEGFVRFLSPSSAAHRLTAVDTDAIRFNSGGVFMAMDGFIGNPFGTTNLNSVIFENGSTYVCKAGGNPFGAAEPASVVVFKSGSLFSLQGNVTPSFSGRTYANFQVNYSGDSFQIFDSGAMSVDDLTLTAGQLSFYLSGEPGLSIKGNITLAQGTRLNLMSGLFRLNGTTTQIVSGPGNQGTSVVTVVVENPMGVILRRPFATYNLDLISGIVTTENMAYVSAGGVVTRTNGYVNGYLNRAFFLLALMSLTSDRTADTRRLLQMLRQWTARSRP